MPWDHTSITTREVDLGPVRLALVEAGRGGRPLLLAHGFTGTKEDFADWIDPLVEAGWWVVAPDHRGHGGSSKLADESAYTLATLGRPGGAGGAPRLGPLCAPGSLHGRHDRPGGRAP